MKTKFCGLILVLAASLARAQTNDLTSLLQQGLLEEQANRNLDAAIADYQSLATQYDKNRQIAATAIFRLGECYRMEGRTNEAAAHYQRILSDFSDQQTLATLSRQDLTGMGMAADAAATGTPAAVPGNSDAALWNKLKDLPKSEVEKMLPVLVPDPTLNNLIEKRNEAEQQFAILDNDYSQTNIVVLRVKSALDILNRQIDTRIEGLLDAVKMRAQVSGIDLTPGSTTGPNNSTDPESQEIQRIQTMIQNSPDLINAREPGGGNTPLGKAAYNGWLRVATFLLDHGADVNAANSDALFSATRAGNRAMVELLLNHGANVNDNGENTQGQTPLHLAVSQGFTAVAEALLAHHANVNAQDASGQTPLSLAAQTSPEIVSLLLAHQADVNLKDNNGLTPLIAAVEAGRPEIVKLLIAAGANVNTATGMGRSPLSNRRTPLSYAAWKHSPEMVKLLLAAQADPNGGTVDLPLLVAIKRKDVASTELLLQAGANPNLAGNIELFDDLNGYFLNHHDHLTPLWLAFNEDDFPMVQLLLKYKADPDDSQTEGYSLLFDTLADTNILEALLDAGAKVDPHRSNGWTPLYQAVSNRGTALAAIKILLDHGANPNVSDDNGYTALYRASALLDGSNIVAMLLDYKADPNLRSASGETPLSMLKSYAASSNNQPEPRAAAAQLADLLRQHGALDKLPDWNSIIVSRPSANFSSKVFFKDANDWNHYTLLEVLAELYKSSQGFGSYFQSKMIWTPVPSDVLSFPDLAHITIVRLQLDSTNETRIEVNLLDPTNGIDCARDVPLQFGDVVEIPEYNHPLATPSIGVTQEQFTTMLNYLTGKVELVTRGQKVELPFQFYNGGSRIENVLRQTEALSVLETSSDLSRVKVTRHNPQTGQTQSWILDCRDLNHAPDLRVRDGDVIEVSEKPE